MEYAFSDIRKVCEHLSLYTDNLYKARLENGVYLVFENEKKLFQSSSLKEVREYLMILRQELKNKGLL